MVYDDEQVCSFMTIGPVNPGHLLVVPKKHLPSLSDLDAGTGAHLFLVTMRMAAALRRSGLRCEGINLFLADGEAAFQEVFHVHMHVFPRYQGDSFKIKANWKNVPNREELDRIAAHIKQAVGES
jgi:histidine triad (HIT) family protein